MNGRNSHLEQAGQQRSSFNQSIPQQHITDNGYHRPRLRTGPYRQCRHGTMKNAGMRGLDAALVRGHHSPMRVRLVVPLLAVLAIFAAGCDWPNIAPPGSATVRYRDPVFNAVSVTSNMTYGTAVNLEGQTITLQLDMYQPTGDTVTARP